MRTQVHRADLLLLEKLIVFQVGKLFPAFFGTRMFIAVFTTARLYPESNDSILHPQILRYISVQYFIVRLDFSSNLFQVFGPKSQG